MTQLDKILDNPSNVQAKLDLKVLMLEMYGEALLEETLSEQADKFRQLVREL